MRSLAAALLLAACGPPEPAPARATRTASAPGVVLVQKLVPDEAGNAAAGMGVLTLQDGCLFMAHRDGSRTLLLWPADSRLERSSDGELRVLPGGPGHAVRIGEEISVGGSELWAGEGDSELVGPGRRIPATAAFPPGCTGRVWNIYTVEPGPPAELPVPQGRWTVSSNGLIAEWPGDPQHARLRVSCVPGAREVELAASTPVVLNPAPDARPPRPVPVPTALEISARKAWARWPAVNSTEGSTTARAQADDPFLDRLAADGFTVRTGRGVTQFPPGGPALAGVLSRCRG